MVVGVYTWTVIAMNSWEWLLWLKNNYSGMYPPNRPCGSLPAGRIGDPEYDRLYKLWTDGKVGYGHIGPHCVGWWPLTEGGKQHYGLPEIKHQSSCCHGQGRDCKCCRGMKC